MKFVAIILLAIIGFIIMLVILRSKERTTRLAAMSPQMREEYLANEKVVAATKLQMRRDRHDTITYGAINSLMVCPHCNVKGKVRTKRVTNKKGVSGGKATAAILTGGFSLLAVGLSRKEANTQARCGNCANSWTW